MKQKPQIKTSEDVLKILKFSDFKNLADTIAKNAIDPYHTRRLVISGSTINSFDFLKDFPSLEQLGFLACKSDIWSDLNGNTKITSLRLHNLKQGKQYLSNIDFIHTFQNLQYLYINMFGIDNFSALQDLKYLHTIFAQCRNGNNIKKQFDFSALEFLPHLQVFDTWMAVDRHKILAESLVPVLKNPSISSLTVTQMFVTESKKLQKLIKKINPKLLETTLPHDELQDINRKSFAW